MCLLSKTQQALGRPFPGRRGNVAADMAGIPADSGWQALRRGKRQGLGQHGRRDEELLPSYQERRYNRRLHNGVEDIDVRSSPG